MKIQKEEHKDLKEEEHLFHSEMWVKGSLLQFIVDSESQKNLISAEVVKWLGLPTTTHPQSQPYLWKQHVVYESRPRVVIVTLGNKLYRIPEVVPPTAIYLVTAKQCSKLISNTGKFVFLMIHPQGKKNTVATTSRHGLSARQKQMNKVVEEYEDIFTSPVGVPLHCELKQSIDLTLGPPLPNGSIYHHSIMENDKIKRQIQELLQKGHI
eukprot:PITA_01423